MSLPESALKRTELSDLLKQYLEHKQIEFEDKLSLCRSLFSWTMFGEVAKKPLLYYISKCILLDDKRKNLSNRIKVVS